jgi:hypothetical protein
VELGIHVGVAINEAGGDRMTLGVDLAFATLGNTADLGDSPAGNADIGVATIRTGTIHHQAVAHDKIKPAHAPFLPKFGHFATGPY